MAATPTGEIKKQITKNDKKFKQNTVELEAVKKRIEVAEKDLEIATREGRKAGDYPFWVSIQGKQHILDTLKDERFNLAWSRDLLESRGRGLREQLIRVGEYRDWESENKKELEETKGKIERITEEIWRLRTEDNENKARLRELVERGTSVEGKVEDIKWDNWSKNNLLQRNLHLESKLIEKAVKIEEKLREEGELEEEEEVGEISEKEARRGINDLTIR